MSGKRGHEPAFLPVKVASAKKKVVVKCALLSIVSWCSLRSVICCIVQRLGQYQP